MAQVQRRFVSPGFTRRHRSRRGPRQTTTLSLPAGRALIGSCTSETMPRGSQNADRLLVSSGGIWKTPQPRIGVFSTPLFRVTEAPASSFRAAPLHLSQRRRHDSSLAFPRGVSPR